MFLLGMIFLVNNNGLFGATVAGTIRVLLVAIPNFNRKKGDSK